MRHKLEDNYKLYHVLNFQCNRSNFQGEIDVNVYGKKLSKCGPSAQKFVFTTISIYLYTNFQLFYKIPELRLTANLVRSRLDAKKCQKSEKNGTDC